MVYMQQEAHNGGEINFCELQTPPSFTSARKWALLDVAI